MSNQAPEFQGRVVRSPFADRARVIGVTGRHEVWIAHCKADVAAAVANTQNRKIVVRSSLQRAAVSDVVHASGGIVLDLTHLGNIATVREEVRAEAGATCGHMATYLAAKHLAIPLANNTYQSIASTVVNEGPSCLMRTLGPLSSYVSSADVVMPDGIPTTFAGPTALTDAKAQNAILTEVAFKPAPTDDLWMICKSFAYPGKAIFAALIKALFLNTNVPQRSDLVLDTRTTKHQISVIRITCAGRGETDKAIVMALVEKAIANCGPGLTDQQILSEYLAKEKVIGALVEQALGVPLDPQIDGHRIHKVVEAEVDLETYLDLVADDVHRGLALKDDGTGKVDENLHLFLRYQLNSADMIEISGFICVRHQEPGTFVERLARGGPPSFPDALPSLAPGTVPQWSLSQIIGELGGAIQDLLAHLKSDVLGELLPVGDQHIPEFKGDIYVPSECFYSWAAHQYATSSYPAADMTPFMLAYPRDEADIQAAIVFAKGCNKKIVARSGGHQYCGMSSGGSGTIVLSMDRFDNFTRISDTVVEVGPRTLLTDLAAEFKRAGITIPHGECPLVNIGGHAQTGGYGHFLRSFGLALDYIAEITIVLADGSIKRVKRPAGYPTTDDDYLFWAVLGGNAGSFGIVTKYQFQCVRDIDHPNSYGFMATRQYDKTRYKNLMKEVQKWTKSVASEDQTFPLDVDFMMTVESTEYHLLYPPIHLIELVYSNVGGLDQQFDPEQFFASIISASNEQPKNSQVDSTVQGLKSLSALADSFVRRFPKTTLDGREFPYPYRKRVNSTVHKLSDEFIDRFVDLIDKAVNTKGVYLVFQMSIGGGAYRYSKRRPQTSIPRRDYVYCFVFDLFYEEAFQETAEQLQAEMQGIVSTVYSPQQEERMLWGSFGDICMSDPTVVNYYYDDLEAYRKLQGLKKQLDRTDLFHSPFTVQLPA
jgi:FAD/FMN-containing dehydrogenase